MDTGCIVAAGGLDATLAGDLGVGVAGGPDVAVGRGAGAVVAGGGALVWVGCGVTGAVGGLLVACVAFVGFFDDSVTWMGSGWVDVAGSLGVDFATFAALGAAAMGSAEGGGGMFIGCLTAGRRRVLTVR